MNFSDMWELMNEADEWREKRLPPTMRDSHIVSRLTDALEVAVQKLEGVSRDF